MEPEEQFEVVTPNLSPCFKSVERTQIDDRVREMWRNLETKE